MALFLIHCRTPIMRIFRGRLNSNISYKIKLIHVNAAKLKGSCSRGRRKGMRGGYNSHRLLKFPWSQTQFNNYDLVCQRNDCEMFFLGKTGISGVCLEYHLAGTERSVINCLVVWSHAPFTVNRHVHGSCSQICPYTNFNKCH